MAEAAQAAEAPEAPEAPGAPLDEVMLAMDVVDTLRHREHLVARELSEEAREQDLLARLRTIYAGQGIEVPDRILKEGIEGLKRERFVYEQPPRTLRYQLAVAWVTRWSWGRWAGAAALAALVAWAGYTYGVRLPAERRAEAERIELAETIPARLAELAAAVETEAEVAEAGPRAQALMEQGQTAAREGNRAAAQAAVADLEGLLATLRREYEIRIVSRPGERSGVWRIPDVNAGARNYYLIVEAFAPDGQTLTLPIRNEETGAVAQVGKWGQRVPQEVFDQVRRDKEGDGIVQDAAIGAKRRGHLEPEFTVPVEPGAITAW